jgi:hypothetical protein
MSAVLLCDLYHRIVQHFILLYGQLELIALITHGSRHLMVGSLWVMSVEG